MANYEDLKYSGLAESAMLNTLATNTTNLQTEVTTLSETGGSSKADFVAAGTLPNGTPVILKADGTVEAVGTPAEVMPIAFNTSMIAYVSSSFDPNTAGKFVIAYQDTGNSSYGKAIVGTVSGTTMTFGTEVVFNAGSTNMTSISFDPNTAGTFVIAYSDAGNSSYGKAIVGTVSGTSISFGAGYVFHSGSTAHISIVFDPNTARKFIVAYTDQSSSPTQPGRAKVCTVSGTYISVGGANTFNAATSHYMSIAFDPNTAGKFVIAYRDYNNSYNGTAMVGTMPVSGTYISFGTAVVFNAGSTNYISSSFDPNTAGKFVIAYRDAGNLSRGTAIVGTVSGTSISFGTKQVFNSDYDYTYHISLSFDPNTAGKFVIAYCDNHNSGYGMVIEGTVYGTAMTFGTAVVFNAGSTYHISLSFDPNMTDKFVIAYRDANNGNYGTALLSGLEPEVSNLTADNFMGLSTAAYTDAEIATITLPAGMSTNQSGLTQGAVYYVQTDGTLATTPDDPSVIVGKAISSTSLLLKAY
jgi:uncharacterized membrane protein